MCFSFEVSIGTFIVSWSISLYLLGKKLDPMQRKHIKFLMLFSTIQLADALLWYSGMKKNKLNYYTTSFLIPSILSLMIIYNLYYRNDFKDNMFVNLFTVAMCLYLFSKFHGYSKSVCDGSLSSPIWGSDEIRYWQIVIYGLAIMYPFWQTVGFELLIVVPLIFYFANGAYGSLWCAVANLMALKYLYQYHYSS